MIEIHKNKIKPPIKIDITGVRNKGVIYRIVKKLQAQQKQVRI